MSAVWEITLAVYTLYQPAPVSNPWLTSQHNQHTCVPYTHIHCTPSPPPRKVTPSPIQPRCSSLIHFRVTTSKIPLRLPQIICGPDTGHTENSFQHLETEICLVDITFCDKQGFVTKFDLYDVQFHYLASTPQII